MVKTLVIHNATVSSLAKKNYLIKYFFPIKTILGFKYRLLKQYTDPLNILCHTSILVVLLISPCGRDINIAGYPVAINRFHKRNSTIYVYY